MSIKKCLQEVKNVVKDILTDEEIEIVLTKVKSNLSLIALLFSIIDVL